MIGLSVGAKVGVRVAAKVGVRDLEGIEPKIRVIYMTKFNNNFSIMKGIILQMQKICTYGEKVRGIIGLEKGGSIGRSVGRMT